MIYFLPERIYNYILENKISDVLDKLNALSDKYNSFTTFEEYIKYSSLFIENEDNKKVYADIKSSIKEVLVVNSPTFSLLSFAKADLI